MNRTVIDAHLFRDMVYTSAALLEKNKTVLNDLNVFPVPDGDTGTNMCMTMVSAMNEVKKYRGEDDSVSKLANELSMGALRGARGNSGVILSQIFRGFAKGINGEATIDSDGLARALSAGVDAAYKAVMKPKEGTILTVVKAMAQEATKQAQKGADLFVLLDRIIDEGERVLQLTPEMLPVLKEAGVVDAGGKGILFIINGFRMALNGMEITDYDFDTQAPAGPTPGGNQFSDISAEDIKFGYCTEFFVRNLKGDVDASMDRLKEKLNRIGDSIVVVGDTNLIKVHVHTNSPGVALQYGLVLGDLSGVKIDNMREQHTNIVNGAMEEAQKAEQSKPKEMKPFAIVAVATGEGIENIFKDLMVDEIVEGGQTMNPSTEDIAKAVMAAPSDNVFVLPNNKNIIMAAQMAAEIKEKNVYVIPTKSVPQGISAILAFNPDAPAEENEEAMKEAITMVKTGQITTAVRDSKVNGFTIKQNDYIGMLDGDIKVVGNEMGVLAQELLDLMVDDNTDVVTIFYGQEVEESAAEALKDKTEEKYPMCDISLFNGGQAVYQYIFSAE